MKDMLIKDYMTEMPHSIDPTQSVAQAKEKMIELKCRHLPVLSGRQIVGIISERDVMAVNSITSERLKDVPVGEVMLGEVIKVDYTATVNEVVSKMSQNKIGSVLVTDGSKLKGIFTDTDAITLLRELTS